MVPRPQIKTNLSHLDYAPPKRASARRLHSGPMMVSQQRSAESKCHAPHGPYAVRVTHRRPGTRPGRPSRLRRQNMMYGRMQGLIRSAAARITFPAAALVRNSMTCVNMKPATKRFVAITLGVGIVGCTSATLCEQKAAVKEGGESQNEDDIYADISKLQTWDSNWDGRYFVHPKILYVSE